MSVTHHVLYTLISELGVKPYLFKNLICSRYTTQPIICYLLQTEKYQS